MNAPRSTLDSLLALPYRLLGGKDEFWRIFRYLLVGGWNTLFGVGLYCLLVLLPWCREHYLITAIPCNAAAITNAFLCYKLFVFRTKGAWLREYARCYIVYGAGALIGMGLLWLFVDGFGLHPALAQCLGVVVTTAFSYAGHKLFSFRRPASAQAPRS